MRRIHRTLVRRVDELPDQNHGRQIRKMYSDLCESTMEQAQSFRGMQAFVRRASVCQFDTCTCANPLYIHILG